MHVEVDRHESPSQAIWSEKDVLILVKEDVAALKEGDKYWSLNGALRTA